jgi:mannosyl-3-phosphoglycerate phosphatase family protein
MGMIVFSDLDGTLLDHETYSFEAALPALQALKSQGIPLVLCSSKTRAEMLGIWLSLGLNAPFIAENGGGVFVPKEHFLAAEPGWKPAGPGWRMMALGKPIAEVRAAFAGFKERFSAKGFGDLSDQAVAVLTGLSEAEAARAREREFNEPVWLPEPDQQTEAFMQAAREVGLEVTRGGRFFHLLAGGDKGKAVQKVAGLYRIYDDKLLTMALGDAPNDLPMLAQADRPVLVARPDGVHAGLDLTGLIREPGIGPIGWNRAVLNALQDLA